MQLSVEDRKRGFGKSGRKVAAVTSMWCLAGYLVWECFSPSAHPLDRCPLLRLGGYLNTLNGEQNTAALSKGSKVEPLLQYHIQNASLNRRKGEETGMMSYVRI